MVQDRCGYYRLQTRNVAYKTPPFPMTLTNFRGDFSYFMSKFLKVHFSFPISLQFYANLLDFAVFRLCLSVLHHF